MLDGLCKVLRGLVLVGSVIYKEMSVSGFGGERFLLFFFLLGGYRLFCLAIFRVFGNLRSV